MPVKGGHVVAAFAAEEAEFSFGVAVLFQGRKGAVIVLQIGGGDQDAFELFHKAGAVATAWTAYFSQRFSHGPADPAHLGGLVFFELSHAIPRSRSEERRVGKECRSRWSPYH